MITSREQVTERIVSNKVRLGIQWSEVANKIGLSKEWVTAACLGQMAMEKSTQRRLASYLNYLTKKSHGCKSYHIKGLSPQQCLQTH